MGNEDWKSDRGYLSFHLSTNLKSYFMQLLEYVSNLPDTWHPAGEVFIETVEALYQIAYV